jgi:hypothetical protein
MQGSKEIAIEFPASENMGLSSGISLLSCIETPKNDLAPPFLISNFRFQDRAFPIAPLSFSTLKTRGLPLEFHS